MRHACQARIQIKESVGRSSDQRQGVFHVTLSTGATRRPRQAKASRKVAAWERKLVAAELRQTLASLGHPARLKLLIELLNGPAVYQSLRRVTRMAPGPLYHHINQLRIAGLIRPKERNLYELTRGGRNLILVTAAAGGLFKDRRARVPTDR